MMIIRPTLGAALLALSAALPLATLVAPPAQAQSSRYANSYASGSARIDAFSVNQLDRVTPGSDLEFTLDGTPGAEVTLRIAGAAQQLRMNEERPGSYRAAYTVRSRDRIGAATRVSARMVKDGQVVTVPLDQSLVAGQRSPSGMGGGNALASNAAGSTGAPIAAFNVNAPDRVRPGDDIGFSLTGAPGGTARVAVKGVSEGIPLTEVSRGVYEGNYTVRRQDHLNGAISATGYLKVDQRESSQRFDRQFVTTTAGGGGDAQRRDRGGSSDAQRVGAVQRCASCGVIQSVDKVEIKSDTPNVVGTIAGGVLGGVLGNQVGGGSGKDLATIAGAVGGAYAGNRVQSRMGRSTEYHVVVRLDGGGTRTFKYADDPAVQSGVRVRIENDTLIRL